MSNEVLALVEHNRLVELEQRIDVGLKTFVDVGSALLEIRDSRLYRVTHPTSFEDYLSDRWPDVGRVRAYQLIDAAVVVENVKNFLQPPRVESHAAKLSKLEPQVQPIAWQQAVDTAPNGKVTAAHVEKVAQEYKPKKERKKKPASPPVDDDVFDYQEEVSTIELNEEEQRHAYFFGLFQEGERLFNAWFDAESPKTRQQYRDELCSLMVRVDKER